MSNTLIDYSLNNGVATITLDDGKRNALSPKMFTALNAAFDRAEADKAIVILTGREDVFSAGFDLKVMKKGGSQALTMLKAGYSITARVMEYPYPVIVACNGHALAMGVFLMLSADYVIGRAGDFKISANEVAIGLPLPRVAEATLRHRLAPAAFQRAGILAEYFSVDAALQAGFFDAVVEGKDLTQAAQNKAEEFAKLDMDAHRISKRRVRKDVIKHIRRCVPLDLKDALMIGVKTVIGRK